MVLKEHEKFWAFLVLIAAIVGLVFLASTFDRGAAADVVVQGKLRIIDSSIAGLLAILGMAAQALFRIGQGEKVTIDNKRSDPVPTEPQPPITPHSEPGELPDDQKVPV